MRVASRCVSFYSSFYSVSFYSSFYSGRHQTASTLRKRMRSLFAPTDEFVGVCGCLDSLDKTDAESPKTASGSPNVGLFVGFNLPVYRNKYRAGVCEALERAMADAKLYEAQRDETASEIQDLMVQARAQQNVLALLRDSILPRTKDSLDLARSDYAKSNVDYATVLSTLREVLQVQLQIAQVEAELAKALAALERAVGCQLNEHPPAMKPAEPR